MQIMLFNVPIENNHISAVSDVFEKKNPIFYEFRNVHHVYRFILHYRLGLSYIIMSICILFIIRVFR